MPLYASGERGHCSIAQTRDSELVCLLLSLTGQPNNWNDSDRGDVCGRRRLFSLAVRQILFQILDFIVIKVLKFNALSISVGSKFPLWMIKDSQIQFPPCWCRRTAEWMEKWMSHLWFTVLITQMSLLHSWRGFGREKVSRLTRIKTRLQCMSQPSLLCPPHTWEKMPPLWRFKYLNSFAKARSLVHKRRGKNIIGWHKAHLTHMTDDNLQLSTDPVT